jgi:hypothetical protein
MRRGFVRRHLRSESLRRLFTGVILTWLFAPGLAIPLLMVITGDLKGKVVEAVGMLLFAGAAVAFALWMVWSGVVALSGLGSHPDLLALRRYGPVEEVLARVPWVLERFDPEAERAWAEDRSGILAEMDRRREQFRSGGQPGAPMTPA